uniref:Uncharacterized protein n=1 Tax=Rhizophora mucronata TaxID=61149 RepID=A0A2P2LF61_RHIMU
MSLACCFLLMLYLCIFWTIFYSSMQELNFFPIIGFFGSCKEPLCKVY